MEYFVFVILLEYTPGEVAPRFKSWNLRSRMSSPTLKFIDVGIVVSVPSYLSVLTWTRSNCVSSVRTFSVQQDTYSSVIEGPQRLGNRNPVM